MSQEYKSETPRYCIICGEQIKKGDKVETASPRYGRTIYLCAHAECYAKEKSEGGRKA